MNALAEEARKMVAPAMSDDLTNRFNGTASSADSSPRASIVACVILLGNLPGAMTLDVMFDLAKDFAMCRESWCTAAFDDE
jgi:hypothetical protein